MTIAIITGGSRGLGRSAALQCAARRSAVILTYNSHPEGADEVARAIEAGGGRAVALKLDVVDTAPFPASRTLSANQDISPLTPKARFAIWSATVFWWGTIFPEVPPRVEYELTESARAYSPRWRGSHRGSRIPGPGSKPAARAMMKQSDSTFGKANLKPLISSTAGSPGMP